MKKLSWEPINEGETYCAPACGLGCTVKEYDITTANAEMLAQTLGPGWVPQVWENLGWHCSAESPCDRLSVQPLSTGFIAFLGEPGAMGGRWAEQGYTPQEAVTAVVTVAVAEYEGIGALIEGLA